MKQSGSILFSLLVFCVLISISLSAVADGKSQYDRYCGECHGLTLKGSGHGPELAGPNFINKWGNRSTREFYTLISETMPAGDPGSLGEVVNREITAYILGMNGAAGSEPLATDQLHRSCREYRL